MCFKEFFCHHIMKNFHLQKFLVKSISIDLIPIIRHCTQKRLENKKVARKNSCSGSVKLLTYCTFRVFFQNDRLKTFSCTDLSKPFCIVLKNISRCFNFSDFSLLFSSTFFCIKNRESLLSHTEWWRLLIQLSWFFCTVTYIFLWYNQKIIEIPQYRLDQRLMFSTTKIYYIFTIGIYNVFLIWLIHFMLGAVKLAFIPLLVYAFSVYFKSSNTLAIWRNF